MHTEQSSVLLLEMQGRQIDRQSQTQRIVTSDSNEKETTNSLQFKPKKKLRIPYNSLQI